MIPIPSHEELCTCRMPYVTGTSVLGLTFNGGVVIASDMLGKLLPIELIGLLNALLCQAAIGQCSYSSFLSTTALLSFLAVLNLTLVCSCHPFQVILECPFQSSQLLKLCTSSWLHPELFCRLLWVYKALQIHPAGTKNQ